VERTVTAPAGANGAGSGGAPAGTDAASVAAALVKLGQQERELSRLRDQVRDLARMVASGDGRADDGDSDGYEPIPAPRWWNLGDQARAEAIERIASWVDHVFRPGYGHLAAQLGDCWREHNLCLYLLDWLSELWTVLYSADERGPGLLGSQAELQTRILPAAAEQLRKETDGCDHALAAERRWDR
jgi:hypothetical protein